MVDFLSNWVGIVVVLGLVLVYIGSYYFNKKTPIAVDCIELANNASCKSCHNFACSHKG